MTNWFTEYIYNDMIPKVLQNKRSGFIPSAVGKVPTFFVVSHAASLYQTPDPKCESILATWSLH